MFHKTSSIEFLEYGDVYVDQESFQGLRDVTHSLPVQNHSLIYLYQADGDVYLHTEKGICLLVISHTPEPEDFHTFVIHRFIRIRKGEYFNFIALSDNTSVALSFSSGTHIQNCFFETEYCYSHITPGIKTRDLIAYYYNVRGTNYYFPGEAHQFWELTYVDSGKLITEIEDKTFTVTESQCILYAPHQFHRQKTDGQSCSYLTIVADMEMPADYRDKLINKVFTADRETKKGIDLFVASSNRSSAFNPDKLILSVEGIILSLLSATEGESVKSASTPMQQKFENELLEQILLYINENLYTALNVEELCEVFAISRSSMQSLFHENLNTTPKEFITSLKMKKSKELIRSSKYTVSEIASMLGFSSIHYFSRKFKQEFGMNPTDYANRIL